MRPPDCERICALIVCYKDYEAAVRCLHSVLGQSVGVKKIYVIDNTEPPDLTGMLAIHEKIEVITLYRNAGISGAYEVGFERGIADGMEWCWTFDQDSVARPNALMELLQSYRHIYEERIGIVAATGVSRVNGKLYRGNNASWISLKEPVRKQSVYRCHLVISAGALTNLRYFQRFGYSFRGMFIDWVDYEICVDMMRNDFGVYCSQLSFYEHHIGGQHAASYAENDRQERHISRLRLACFIKNSLYVIIRSPGLLKYFYLPHHGLRLVRASFPGNLGLFINNVYRGFTGKL